MKESSSTSCPTGDGGSLVYSLKSGKLSDISVKKDVYSVFHSQCYYEFGIKVLISVLLFFKCSSLYVEFNQASSSSRSFSAVMWQSLK